MSPIDPDAEEPPIIYTPPSRLSKSTRAIGFLIFLLALLARAACLKQLADSPSWDLISPEAAGYVEWANRMVAGDWIGTGAFPSSPLYAYFLGVVFSLSGPGLLAARLIQIVIGSATCVLIQRIGRQAFTPLAGVLAGTAAALYAPFLAQDVTLDKEVFVVFFLCAAVYQLLAADGSQRGLLATAGVCLGLAALTRESLVLMAPVISIWLLIDPWLRGRMTTGRAREGLGRVGAFAVGLLLVIVPVTVRNYNLSGRPVPLTTTSGDLAKIRIGDGYPSPSRSLLVLLNRNEPAAPPNHERRRDAPAPVPALPVLRLPLPAWGWAAPIALAGIVLSFARWREALVFYILGGGYIVIAVLLGFEAHRMPLVPLMLLFAAHGGIEIAVAIRRRRYIRAKIGVVALLTGAILVNLTL